jgi:putative transposase
MKNKRFSDSQILAILKQADNGIPVSELCREHGTGNSTFYKWRAEYGGMDVSLMAKMKELEDENRRLQDNAPTERFFRSLKHEQLNYQTFKTKKAAELSILDYLAYYNGKRPHSVNRYLSPIQYENEVAKKVSGFY